MSNSNKQQTTNNKHWLLASTVAVTVAVSYYLYKQTTKKKKEEEEEEKLTASIKSESTQKKKGAQAQAQEDIAQKQAILDFWFGTEPLAWRGGLWWGGIDSSLSAKTDTPALVKKKTKQHIRKLFGALFDRAGDPEFIKAWSSTQEGSVALVVLLDVLARGLLDESAKVTMYNKVACDVARESLKSPAELQWSHRMFLCVALMHSEDERAVQQACAELLFLIEAFPNLKDSNGKELLPRILGLHKRCKAQLKKISSMPPATITSEETTSPASKASLGSSDDYHPRLLVLHGNRANLSGFKRKTKDQLKRVSPHLHYVAAPHMYKSSSDDQSLQNQPWQSRCWWTVKGEQEGGILYEGLPASIQFLESVFEHEGPFDGIVGFSQGGALAAILAGLQQNHQLKHIKFDFVICISAPYCRDVRPNYCGLHVSPSLLPGSSASGTTMTPAPAPPSKTISLPSFHLWGLEDRMVEPWRSICLSKAFDSPATSSHPADHFNKAIKHWPVQQIREWVDQLPTISGSCRTHNKKLQTLSTTPHTFLEKLQVMIARRADATIPEPVGLQKLQYLVNSDEWEVIRSAEPLYSTNGITRSQARALVQKGFNAQSDEQEERVVVDELMMLAWSIYPFLIKKAGHRCPKTPLLSCGEVFYWMVYAIYEQASPSGRMHLLQTHLPLVVRQGSWESLVRLDLLAVTGSSLRTSNLAPSEQKTAEQAQQAAQAEAQQLHQAVAVMFADQLTKDYEVVAARSQQNEGKDYSDLVSICLGLASRGQEFPSPCALHAPRLQGYVHKSTRLTEHIAHILSRTAVGGDGHGGTGARDWKYPKTRYKDVTNELRKFLGKFSKDRLAKLRAEAYHTQTWTSITEKEWLSLLSAPLSKAVLYPEPEPVDVSTSEQMKPLYEFLNSGQSLQQDEQSFTRGTLISDGRLDLCKQVIGPSGVDGLMESLRIDSAKQFNLVKHILLGNNVAGDGLAKEVAKFIASKRSKLTTWYIAGNCLTETGIRPLCEALKHDSDVLQLWLKRNPLGLGGANCLAGLLRTNSPLHVLDLTTTAMGDEGTAIICEALEHNTNLQYLYLDGNGISIEGVKTIQTYLLSGKGGLVSLSLGCNRIQDEGARIIAKSLQTHPRLKRLCLASCGIGPKGAEHLAQMLTTNTELRFLDLGFLNMTAALEEIPNRIGVQGTLALARALQSNTTLLSLDISQNCVAPAGVSGVWEALKSNPLSKLCEFKQQQFGFKPLLEDLTQQRVMSASLAYHLKQKASEVSDEEKEWLRPKHLEDILSVYRLGNSYL